MNLTSTQIKDTYGNLVTIGSVAGTPTTGTLQNGAGSDLTSITVNGGAVFNEGGGNFDFRVEGDTVTNLLFVDASADKVGIGTSSPATRLDVQAVSGAVFRASVSSDLSNIAVIAGATKGVRIGANTTGGFMEGVDNTGVASFQPLTLGGSDIRFSIGGVSLEKMRISSAGNVGIGTTSPARLLDVNGDASIYGVRVGRGAGAISTNTAVGNGALDANTTGTSNTATGRDALKSNTTGGSNTANGQAALYSNTTGVQNTANGLQALYSNTTANNNTANGFQALFANTTGGANTANGFKALYSNETGSSNTANGYQALFSNTTGGSNTANGLEALYSNTTGNNNTANGRDALYSNTTASNNVANGYRALFSNTTGGSNTANGVGALYSNTTGNNNVGNGYQALYSNTTGINNTANGFQALFSNTTGSSNSANGFRSLYSNTTGGSNVANGREALYSNTTGAENVANGYQALYSNTTGINNVANGLQALYSNTTANNNTANGYQALYSNTTGANNSALGRDAGYACTTGSGNIMLGGLTNAGTRSPVFSVTTENNQVVMGTTAVTDAHIQVAWTVVSDERDKMNFGAVPHGLAFVNQLTPISYQFRAERGSDTPNGRLRYGFKAQDILAIEGEDSVIINADDPDKLRYNGESLVPVLVNAIQELTAKVEELQAELLKLKTA